MRPRGSAAERTKSDVSTSPLPSTGPKRGPYILGVPGRGMKMTRGYASATLLGAQNWAYWLPNPCVLGNPQKRRQNKMWLHNRCLLGAQKGGGGSYVTPALSGVLAKRDKMRGGYITIAFPGARSGRNRYATPLVFLVFPSKGDKIRKG